jgi:hypothetical protein
VQASPARNPSASRGHALLLTCADVQELAQVGRHAALRLIHSAGAVRIGGSLRCRRQDLEELLERLATESKA